MSTKTVLAKALYWKKSPRFSKWLSLGLALALAGCGSSGESSLGSAQAVAAGPPPALSGRVTDEGGAPLTGVRLVLQERTSRREAHTTSDIDGGFSVDLAPGVYDVGLDLEGNQSLATAFYGPITVEQSGRHDFVLPPAEARQPGEVFGRIFSRQGVPAPGRNVAASPGFIAGGFDGQEVGRVSTVTGDDGSFSLDFGSTAEIGLDLEVFDEQGFLDEFIDVGKLGKPLYLEFAVEESLVENGARVNQGHLSLTEGSTTALSPLLQSADAGFSRFTSASYDPSLDAYVLVGGYIPPKAPEEFFKNLVPQGVTLPQTLGDSSLLVVDHGLFWWDYTICVKVQDRSNWHFTDATGDTYSLTVLWVEPQTFEGHFVCYNSKAPAVVKVEYESIDDGAGG